jgi:hypothetical protein
VKTLIPHGIFSLIKNDIIAIQPTIISDTGDYKIEIELSDGEPLSTITSIDMTIN